MMQFAVLVRKMAEGNRGRKRSMERDIEKDLIEIKCAAKGQEERDNMFTFYVLQRCYKLVSELKKYKDLEEQGKLLKLPCAVGDTVYEVQESRGRIQPYVVIAVHASECGRLYGWELKDGKGFYSNVNGFSEYAIGKQVFLTREEAEVALKKSGFR